MKRFAVAVMLVLALLTAGMCGAGQLPSLEIKHPQQKHRDIFGKEQISIGDQIIRFVIPGMYVDYTKDEALQEYFLKMKNELVEPKAFYISSADERRLFEGKQASFEDYIMLASFKKLENLYLDVADFNIIIKQLAEQFDTIFTNDNVNLPSKQFSDKISEFLRENVALSIKKPTLISSDENSITIFSIIQHDYNGKTTLQGCIFIAFLCGNRMVAYYQYQNIYKQTDIAPFVKKAVETFGKFSFSPVNTISQSTKPGQNRRDTTERMKDATSKGLAKGVGSALLILVLGGVYALYKRWRKRHSK